MIGKLKGIVESVGDDWVIIDVGGVGYEVTCSGRTLGNLPAIGSEVSLSIETYVREDQIRLFGFGHANDRTWFRLLQSVQGVGAKVALAILSTLTPSDIANAIALQDKAIVAQAQGVGPKVAQRIVTELKDKAPALLAQTGGGTVDAAVVLDGDAGTSRAVMDAVSALSNLGYAPAQASGAVASVMRDKGDGAAELSAQDLIRLGLKELSS